MATLTTTERGRGTWLGRSLELPGGWAGDLAWDEDSLWLAWATCIDEELGLLAVQDQQVAWPAI